MLAILLTIFDLLHGNGGERRFCRQEQSELELHLLRELADVLLLRLIAKLLAAVLRLGHRYCRRASKTIGHRYCLGQLGTDTQ